MEQYRSLKILEDMIAINSENPGSDEREIADYCRNLLGCVGIDTEVVGCSVARPNVIARLEGRKDCKIVYQAHLDTKPAHHRGATSETWTYPPFEATMVGDRIYGLGACDTKGGAAGQLAAMISLARDWDASLPTIEWQGVADEENGSGCGAEYLAAQGLLAADFAVVAEPTHGRVSTRQFGSVWIDARVTGRQAHGGKPWLGRDANAALLILIDRMRSAVAVRPRDRDAPFHPSFGVRILEGGGHAGTVAGTARLVADIRVPPGEGRDEYLALWQSEADRVAAELEVGIELSLASGGGCDPNRVEDPALLALLERSWRQTFDEPLAPVVFFGGSDARYFAACGTPAIVLGAGDLAYAHSPDEFTPIEDVIRCERFLTALPGAFQSHSLEVTA